MSPEMQANLISHKVLDYPTVKLWDATYAVGLLLFHCGCNREVCRS